SNVTIDVLALSASRSRMVVGVDLKPQTLTARLLVQSLKLAKASLTRKFKDRVAGYAADIERQYQSAA
ncbi:MAG: SRPBCC family protein, partial [Pseudomonadota bacterium]